MTPAFRQKVDALTLGIISVLSPYLGTVDGASSIIGEMGHAGRPAIQDFAQAYPTATKRCQDEMLRNLGHLKPSLSDLQWLVASDDPHLIFAGYDAVKDTIKPEERALAKERIDEALTKTTDQHDIYVGKRLSEYLDPIRFEPDQVAAYNARGNDYAKQGDYTKAFAAYNRAIELDPDNAVLYSNRGLTYHDQGNDALALQDLNHSIQLDPKYKPAYNELAWLLATSPLANLRDGKKAVEYATKACELSEWKDPHIVDTLAAAYAESGDFDNAVKWENQYLQNPNLTASDATDGKSHLALYVAHQPYHSEK